MPVAQVRGVNINYEVLGHRGPWMALSPGGRRALGEIRYLAEPLAQAGYRVLLHDRRNCGASDVVIDGTESEYEIWADDLYELLSQLNALPAIIGGSSSGCRLAILFALRRPASVRALLLWRVTGGAFAANRLAENYYGQYIKAARDGGMAAVCATEHFSERIETSPANRDKLMSMDPERFVAVMAHWRDYFLKGADLPIIGANESDLNSITVPTCIIPGNDKTHGRQSGETAHKLIRNSELHHLFTEQLDVDLGPIEEWHAKARQHADILLDFLRRKRMSAVAAA
ncbi:MAG: alpha/beta fold hydrolase [Xanthobacteraceae bacterium]|jgi:pimeloyl-ACP methyl ester carboxylesterase